MYSIFIYLLMSQGTEIENFSLTCRKGKEDNLSKDSGYGFERIKRKNLFTRPNKNDRTKIYFQIDGSRSRDESIYRQSVVDLF